MGASQTCCERGKKEFFCWWVWSVKKQAVHHKQLVTHFFLGLFKIHSLLLPLLFLNNQQLNHDLLHTSYLNIHEPSAPADFYAQHASSSSFFSRILYSYSPIRAASTHLPPPTDHQHKQKTPQTNCTKTNVTVFVIYFQSNKRRRRVILYSPPCR